MDIQVLDRAFQILEEVAQSEDNLGTIEISKRLNLNKSTASRILSGLKSHGYVEQDLDTRKYRLGPKVLELGNKVSVRAKIVSLSGPCLEKLRDETGETAHLSMLSGDEAMYILTKESAEIFRVNSVVGGRVEVHCSAIGKAIIAYLPAEKLTSMLKRLKLKSYTANTITTPEALKKELELTRERGYALDMEERFEGVRCLAAPVRDYSGEAVASLGVSGPAVRVSKDKINELAGAVVKAAQDVSAKSAAKGFQSRGMTK